MKTKPYLYKRVIAYIIDLLIVTIVSSLISVAILDTKPGAITTSDLLLLASKLNEKEITKEQFDVEYNEMYYQITRENFDITAITCIFSLVYYVLIAYLLKGQTLGKKLMRLRIKRIKGNLNMGNLLLRSLLVNLVLSNVLSLVLITVLSKDAFINVYPKISSVFTIIMIISLVLILYRDDGRGVHDLISGTVLINTKDELLNENDEKEVDDAVIIKEKKNEGSGI